MDPIRVVLSIRMFWLCHQLRPISRLGFELKIKPTKLFDEYGFGTVLKSSLLAHRRKWVLPSNQHRHQPFSRMLYWQELTNSTQHEWIKYPLPEVSVKHRLSRWFLVSPFQWHAHFYSALCWSTQWRIRFPNFYSSSTRHTRRWTVRRIPPITSTRRQWPEGIKEYTASDCKPEENSNGPGRKAKFLDIQSRPTQTASTKQPADGNYQNSPAFNAASFRGLQTNPCTRKFSPWPDPWLKQWPTIPWWPAG